MDGRMTNPRPDNSSLTSKTRQSRPFVAPQVVWKATTQIGCAAQNCPNKISNFNYPDARIVVCRYSPSGNWDGEYAANVLPGASQGSALG